MSRPHSPLTALDVERNRFARQCLDENLHLLRVSARTIASERARARNAAVRNARNQNGHTHMDAGEDRAATRDAANEHARNTTTKKHTHALFCLFLRACDECWRAARFGASTRTPRVVVVVSIAAAFDAAIFVNRLRERHDTGLMGSKVWGSGLLLASWLEKGSPRR